MTHPSSPHQGPEKEKVGEAEKGNIFGKVGWQARYLPSSYTKGL